MSAIAVGGRAYAAGLYWLERRGPSATARAARRLARPCYVHHGERTGFAAGDGEDSADGLPALALALLEHIEGAFWMALVEDDGGGPCALVKARDGAVLADGDEFFATRAAALAAFERARALGWALHATPGAGSELEGYGAEIAPIDAEALGETARRAGPAIALTSAAPARGAARRRTLAALGVAALAAVAGLWLGRDALLVWLAESDTVPAPILARPEPAVAVSVDGAALIAGCRRALIDNPPFLPAWEIERIACAARFADPDLAALRPELAGRPVLLVRWARAAGHAEAIARRLAESYLARWHAGAVADGRAWAAAPLAPVLRLAETETPPFLELRAAVDRAFGTGGARLAYARNAAGAWTVRIDDPGPLARLGPVAGGIAGLEIVALSRSAAGPWRLEARPVAPETVTASRLEALGAIDAVPGNGSTEGKETGNATRDHDGS